MGTVTDQLPLQTRSKECRDAYKTGTHNRVHKSITYFFRLQNVEFFKISAETRRFLCTGFSIAETIRVVQCTICADKPSICIFLEVFFILTIGDGRCYWWYLSTAALWCWCTLPARTVYWPKETGFSSQILESMYAWAVVVALVKVVGIKVLFKKTSHSTFLQSMEVFPFEKIIFIHENLGLYSYGCKSQDVCKVPP